MWSEPILHVDMDSFFVEVERLEDPSLVGRPVAVGGTSSRGVIASASYEAREFGVESAQPTSTARRLCPSLTIIPPAHRKYGEKSIEVFGIFRSITPLVEGLSIDEAFLDVSGLTKHFESALEVGEEVRRRVRAETGLPSSVGVAATKFVAKLASTEAKPDGLHHVPRTSQLDFLHALPASSLWGVGPATLAGLERLGIETIGDIAELPESSLISTAGQSLGRRLLDLARGIDPRQVDPDTGAKSISVEQTYNRDLRGSSVIEAALLAHAQKLSVRLRRAGVAARTVGIKVRSSDFATITRSKTVREAVTSARDLYRIAIGLTKDVDLESPVRLLGLSASSLVVSDGPQQLALGGRESGLRLEEAIARVRDAFGDDAVGPARLVPNPDQRTDDEEDD